MGNFWFTVPWFIPVLAKFALGNLAFVYLNKKIVQRNKELGKAELYLPHKLLVQYAITGTIALIVAFSLHQVALDLTIVVIASMGFANAWAAYSQWRAHAIDVSRTAPFGFGQTIIAMSLSSVFLGESHIISPQLAFGIGLAFLGAILLMYSDTMRTRKGREKRRITPKQAQQLYVAIGIYTVIWGLTNFAMKYWAVQQVPVGMYLFGWYVGSFVGAICIVLLTSLRDKQVVLGSKQLASIRKDLLPIFLQSVAITCNFAALYWSHFRAPQVVLFPIYMVLDLIGPLLIGFLFFGEWKGYDKSRFLYLAIASVGGVLIALTMQLS